MILSAEGLGRAIGVQHGLAKFFGGLAEIMEAWSHGYFSVKGSVASKIFGGGYDPAKGPDLFGSASTTVGSSGNSRGERNNNRGNIKYGTFARDHGATGSDEKGFAVFPSMAVGDAAEQALLRTGGYQNLTLAQFAARYAEGSQSWAKTVGQNLGIGLNDKVDTSDPRLLSAIRKAEGTNGIGRAALSAGHGSSSTTTTNVSITGPITVTGVKDAQDFARKVPDAGLRASRLNQSYNGVE
jgi:hypothetical protein